ncbi:hypothetical protein [Halalkalirubrum salinum]|uniref:hypothetical protein n=1 Tax=Halalkalirubrum salinum TaxID=2563889 RepID=UPI0014853E52|nr:hypothetical protein [Halalkalirubrum salinum]
MSRHRFVSRRSVVWAIVTALGVAGGATIVASETDTGDDREAPTGTVEGTANTTTD